MRRVDICTFLGRWPFRPLRGTAAGLARVMRRNGIDRALASPFEGLFYADPEPANEELLRALRGRRRLWAAPIINPAAPDWREQMSRLARNRQVRAFRVAPTFHGYETGLCAEAAREAARLGRALMVQVRLEDERHHSPILDLPAAPVGEITALAAAAPGARIVVSAARLDEVLEAAPQVKGRRNLWFDLSHLDGLDCIRDARRAVGARRLAFSTAWPFFYARSSVLKVEEAQLGPREAEALWGGGVLL